MILIIGGPNYSYRYQLQPIVLIIVPDYAYVRCIGRTLVRIFPNMHENTCISLLKRVTLPMLLLYQLLLTYFIKPCLNHTSMQD